MSIILLQKLGSADKIICIASQDLGNHVHSLISLWRDLTDFLEAEVLLWFRGNKGGKIFIHGMIKPVISPAVYKVGHALHRGHVIFHLIPRMSVFILNPISLFITV